MTDQTSEAIEARYETTRALKALIYGPHYGYLTPAVQGALTAALSAVEESEGVTPEEPANVVCGTCGEGHHDEDCQSGWAPGLAGRAYRAHVNHLPPNVPECRAVGHCGHVECCNCSGIVDRERVRLVIQAYVAGGGK